ncbi:hypothetical protein EBZ38_13380 [bacterium]|nr:hypothetical protein [bacterium]
MKLPNKLKRWLTVVTVGVLILGVVSLIWYGKIAVDTTTPPSSFEVVAGDYIIKPGAAQKLRPGIYRVTIRGKRIQSASVKLSILPFTTKNITNKQKQLTDAQIVATLIGTNESDFVLYKTTYFENDTWLVASTGIPGDSSDKIPVIGKYRLGEWVVVDSGTGLDLSTDKSIPASVLKYLGGDIK